MLHYFFTAVVFVVIFSILVLVHELGHFFMAKKHGIKVEEFGFGLPPRIFGKKVGETVYSLNWIPFGGFVRMLGEDSAKSSMLKNKRSFVAQPLRSRVLVVIAGVLMNFLLAWILLSIGYTVGMKPLYLPEDVFAAIDQGNIIMEEGLKVKTVESGGFAEKSGLKAKDTIISVDGNIIDSDLAKQINKGLAGKYKVVREGEIAEFEISKEMIQKDFGLSNFGAEFYDAVEFPRVKVYNVKDYSSYELSGIKAGDILLKVNDSQIYSLQEHEFLIRGKSELNYDVYRDGKILKIKVILPQKKQAMITEVLQNKPASKAGLKKGDIILSVNEKEVTDIVDLINFTKTQKNKKLSYLIKRGAEIIPCEITTTQEGQIGVMLSELMTYGGDSGVSLYNDEVYSSIIEVKDEKLPFYKAIPKSLYEMWRLSKLTAVMFVSVVADVISGGSVPETVAGPVGIAQMTNVLIKEGFVSILRFLALLSLSLAVINILPFPALDGGRLLFFIVEFIIGRRVNQRLESFVHGVGYALILFLIIMITYSDLIRIFSS